MSRVIGDREILHRLRKGCIDNSTYAEGGLDLSDLVEVSRLLGLPTGGNRSVQRKNICSSLYIDKQYDIEEEDRSWWEAANADVPRAYEKSHWWDSNEASVSARAPVQQRALPVVQWDDPEQDRTPVQQRAQPVDDMPRVQQRAQPVDDMVPARAPRAQPMVRRQTPNRAKWIARLVKQVTDLVLHNISEVNASPRQRHKEVVFSYTWPPHHAAYYVEPGKTQADGIPYVLLIEGNADSIAKGKKNVMSLLSEALSGTPDRVILERRSGNTNIVLVRG